MTRQATRTPGNCNHQTSPEWLLICCNMKTAHCLAALKSDRVSRQKNRSGVCLMKRHFIVAVVFILLPLITLRSQTKTPSNAPLDKPEVTESAKLALEVAQLYKQGKYKQALPLAK